MEVTFSIYRYDPEKDSAPYFRDYPIDVEPTTSLLDCLNHIKWHLDGSISYRRSCQHGVCGSDALKINGVNMLACAVLLKDLKSRKIVVEPLPSMPVVKDLVTDFSNFFDMYKVVKPYLITHKPPPEREWVQSPEDRKLLDGAYECILCGACTTSCPSYWADKSYLGPAALLKAYQMVFDSRDEATDERLDALNGTHELWRCHTIFNCVEVCPKHLNPTWAISELKKKLIGRRY